MGSKTYEEREFDPRQCHLFFSFFARTLEYSNLFELEFLEHSNTRRFEHSNPAAALVVALAPPGPGPAMAGQVCMRGSAQWPPRPPLHTRTVVEKTGQHVFIQRSVHLTRQVPTKLVPDVSPIYTTAMLLLLISVMAPVVLP